MAGCGCFCAAWSGLSSCDGSVTAHTPQVLTTWPGLFRQFTYVHTMPRRKGRKGRTANDKAAQQRTFSGWQFYLVAQPFAVSSLPSHQSFIKMIPPTQKSRELTCVQKCRSCPASGVDRPWVKPHPRLPASHSGATLGPVLLSTWQNRSR